MALHPTLHPTLLPTHPPLPRVGSTWGSVRVGVPVFPTCQAGLVMCSARHSRVGRMVLAGSQEDAAPAAGF